MNKWIGASIVVLTCAVAPLFAPQAWVQRGAFPDLAVLAVLYLAIVGSAERAAVLGVAVGLLRCAWTPEPLGLDAALYGVLGWSGAHVGRAVFQDRAWVKMAAAGIGVVCVRALSSGIAAMTAPHGAEVGGLPASTWAVATAFAALATALVAPVGFAALGGSRALAAFERRAVRHV